MLAVAVLLAPLRAQASTHTESTGQTILHSNLDHLAAILATSVTTEDQSNLSVFTPVAPDPNVGPPPHLDRPVLIPAPPPEFMRSPYYLLVGTIEIMAGRFYLVSEQVTGLSRRPVYSQHIHLASLIGNRIAAIAEPTRNPDGSEHYHILESLVLTADLAGPIQYSTTRIYTAPAAELTIKLRGRRIDLDSTPIVGNGRALVGLRAISEGIGAQVEWHHADRSVTVRLSDRTVTVTVGSLRAIVRQDGLPDQVVMSDVAPVIVDGRTMVPIRLVSAALGLTILWDANSGTIGLQ